MNHRLHEPSGQKNKRSVTADYNAVGVRPSSGAASTGCSDASDSIGARSRSDIAAPEDGRTPPRRSPRRRRPSTVRGYSSLALWRISAKVFEVPMREIRLIFLVLLGILVVSPAAA